MGAIVQCVPNFSEGRDPARVAQIVSVIRSVPGIAVLGEEMDADHNRSVVTLAGPPDAVAEAAYRAIERARDLIDLNVHRGEHPRMGATDVCPIVPVSGISREECIEHARALARRVGEGLGIPVFLYEDAALRPARRNLAEIRRGQFEGLREAIGTDPALEPDFGPRRIHPTAGATAVGVRGPLVAFNVNLDSSDLALAKRIAGKIREKGGGLPAVKAAGFEIKALGVAQVSMNLVDYRRTSPGAAYRAVEGEARAAGVAVRESEIVGLVPQEALVLSAIDLMRPREFSDGQILERRLAAAGLSAGGPPPPAWGVAQFLDPLSSGSPTPGGGSASALAGALAAALGGMVCRLAARGGQDPLGPARAALDTARERLTTLIERDARAYEGYVAAMRLSKGTPEARAKRTAAMAEALREAVAAPLEVMRQTVGLLRRLEEVALVGPAHAASDAAVGALLGRAAVHGAAWNVRINTAGKESRFAEACAEARTLADEADRLASRTEEAAAGRVAGAGEGGGGTA